MPYRAKTADPESEAEKKARMEKTDRAQLDDMRMAKEAAKRIQQQQELNARNPGPR